MNRKFIISLSSRYNVLTQYSISVMYSLIQWLWKTQKLMIMCSPFLMMKHWSSTRGVSHLATPTNLVRLEQMPGEGIVVSSSFARSRLVKQSLFQKSSKPANGILNEMTLIFLSNPVSKFPCQPSLPTSFLS